MVFLFQVYTQVSGRLAVQIDFLKQVCRSSLLSGRNVRWPRRMLPLMNHGEYADKTDGRTDARQTVTLRFLLDAASVIN